MAATDVRARIPMSRGTDSLNVATAAALLVIAIPALSMRVGLPDGGSEPTESSAHIAFTTIDEGSGRAPTARCS